MRYFLVFSILLLAGGQSRGADPRYEAQLNSGTIAAPLPSTNSDTLTPYPECKKLMDKVGLESRITYSACSSEVIASEILKGTPPPSVKFIYFSKHPSADGNVMDYFFWYGIYENSLGKAAPICSGDSIAFDADLGIKFKFQFLNGGDQVEYVEADTPAQVIYKIKCTKAERR